MKKARKRLSIKAQIFIALISITLSILAVLWIFQLAFLGTAYKAVKENSIEKASSLIAHNIDNEELSALIEQTAIDYDVCIMVFKFTNEISTLHDHHFHNDCLIHMISSYDTLLSEWYTSAQENDGYYTSLVPREKFRDFEYNPDDYEGDIPPKPEQYDKNNLISARVTEASDGTKVMVLLNTSIMPPNSTVVALNRILIILTILSIIVSAIISWLISKGISSPIEKINSSTKSLARENYNVYFEEAGPLEVYELSKTLNQATAQLADVDRMRRELIANISHDLRTPLTLISGYSEIMRDIPSENTHENMQIIIDETTRLSSLVNDLLEMSKLQSGTQPMHPTRMSLTSAVLETVKRYTTLTQHNGYKIEFEYSEEIFVLADESRILQVIYNLISNAINYTGADKIVKITQTRENDIVRISVIDSGAGISEEDLPHIWDRYYKVDKVHKRAIMGTGLGLSIVKNILLLHDSRFGVSSEIGKGSTFWFEFKII